MCSISDFCNRLSQASASKLKKTTVKNSKLVLYSLFLLYKLGYITNYKVLSIKFINVTIKYFYGQAVIRGLFSLSKPSLKFYITCKKIQNYAFNNIFGLNGFAALSTSYGKILLDIECVLFKIGGKMLWAVY